MCNYMRLCAIAIFVILARCVMLANMQAYLPSLLPLIRLSGSTWNLVLRSCWHSQNVIQDTFEILRTANIRSVLIKIFQTLKSCIYGPVSLSVREFQKKVYRFGPYIVALASCSLVRSMTAYVSQPPGHRF